VPLGRVVGMDSSADVVAQAVASVGEAAAHLTFEVGDVYALDHPDASFHVVHAHQVLQHLGDPVAALAEMRRVCRPGGIVAVRDSDYAAMTWWGGDARMDRWLELYREMARRNAGEPDAGRRLLGWAHAAGFSDVVATASAWCFATEGDRRWWAEIWAGRVADSTLSRQLVEAGLADQAELDDLATGWEAWAADPDAWFSVLHGELICTV
jgi:SAM-dependent methyltransferase